jgi:hypothetical protein
MIDNDGKFSYSKVLMIRADDQLKTAIGVYPNPAVSQATLSFRSEATRSATVHILNMNGAVVAKQQVQVVTGENAVALTGINHLSAGVYNVRLVLNNTSHNTRLFIQK